MYLPTNLNYLKEIKACYEGGTLHNKQQKTAQTVV